MNGVYSDRFPIVAKQVLNGLSLILEKHLIRTGEPAYNVEKGLFGFYFSHSTFFYDYKNDEIAIYYDYGFYEDYNKQSVKNANVKRYKTLDDDCISDIKKYCETKRKIVPLADMINEVEKYSEYEKDWNSYCCNVVSPTSIASAIELVNKLYDKVDKTYVDFRTYAVADGGHAYKRPPDDSFSIVCVEMENGLRTFELEINEKGQLIPNCFEHVYDDVNFISSGLVWPVECNCDEDCLQEETKEDFLNWAIRWIHYEEETVVGISAGF